MIKEYIDYIIGSDRVIVPREVAFDPDGYKPREELGDNLVPIIIHFRLTPSSTQSILVYVKIENIIKWSKK